MSEIQKPDSASIETINGASEIRLRAERKLGEILAKTPKNPGIKMSGGSRLEPPRIETLADAGISKKTSSRAQALAAAPEEEFEAALDVPPEDVWVLVFRAEGPGPSTTIRVRRLLKAALRSFGLRCTRHCGPDAAGLPRSIGLERKEFLPPAVEPEKVSP